MTSLFFRRLLRASTGGIAGTIMMCGLGAIAVQKTMLFQDEAATDYLGRVEQFPKNESAQALESYLQRLGLGLPTPQGPETRVSTTVRQLQTDLEHYLRAQREREQGSLSKLPPSVETFLIEHEADLTAVEALLLEKPLPAWTVDVNQFTQYSQATEAAQLDFFPLARLQRLFLARSILQHQRSLQAQQVGELINTQASNLQARNLQASHPQASARSLEAAWVLPQSLRARPDLLSQMFASIMQQQQTGLLRHLDGVDMAWQSRLKLDDQAQILQALKFDSWLEYRRHRHRTGRDVGSSWASLGHWFRRPFQGVYLGLSQMDWLQTRLESYERLPDTVCQSHPEQFQLASSWWNGYGRAGAPQWSKEWVKAGDRGLAAELTQKVIQAKHLAAQQGQWPESLPQLQSRICPEVTWRYERLADGGMAITLDRASTWRLDVNHAKLPLRYQAPAYAPSKPDTSPVSANLPSEI